ncbi:MAG TPA: S8 family serine peptidase [Chitinophagaceae bacterium]|nr:S8 family serine peptidase [Chitinophagaceae bacterium]
MDNFGLLLFSTVGQPTAKTFELSLLCTGMKSALTIICPLCLDRVDKHLYRYHLDGERKVIEQIKARNPEWSQADGACSRCVDYYHTEVVMQQRILPEIGPHFSVRSADDFIILPTGLRLDADQRYTGKNVTICFIDSGFYPHPDLTAYKNRVKIIVDITGSTGSGVNEAASAWHGTMTSVVCAGDGYLGKGLYKGIASDAGLVLLKVQDKEGRITTASIVKALQWVIDNHSQFGIRIVNISLGGDEVASYKQSEIDQLAEQLYGLGIIVVAAAGNDPGAAIRPPANSPHVITVGGTDDGNKLDEMMKELYHSAFGKTTDNLMKPELLAPAMWIAAPLLPGTKEQREASVLYQLHESAAEDLVKGLPDAIHETELARDIIQSRDPVLIRDAIVHRIQAAKYISPHYMHVDGTSFAAPIVSAVIAQLLELNPELKPAAVRELLFSTAKRVNNFPAERQGFGMIRPRNTLLKLLKREEFPEPPESPRIDYQKKIISFVLRHDCAAQVSLAGNFNQWNANTLLLEPARNGLWTIDIPLLPAGKWQYKFFVDDRNWVEDVNNPYREPDGFSGFNSLVIIE